MLEILVVLLIISLLGGVIFSLHLKQISPMVHDEAIHLHVEHTRLKAIHSQTRVDLPFLVDQVQLSFNAFGNINQAKQGALSYPYQQSMVFYLGFGAYEIQH